MAHLKSASRELDQERREVGEVEEREPLRRELLIALGEMRRTRAELGRLIAKRPESISRMLTRLSEEGLLTAEQDADDRRHWSYELTPEGRSEVGRHLAFGAAEKALPPPDREERVRFIQEALAGAVAMRRRVSRLQDAIDRLEEVHRQAEAADAPEIALEALAELATTQRQDRQRPALERSLQRLDEMTLGTSQWPQLVLPAIAYLEYERGRTGELAGEDAGAMARHLTAAMSLFDRLLEHRAEAEAEAGSLRVRQAWSVLSLAGNLRSQSMYEDSLRHAASALRMFDDLEDEYGRSQCWFTFGFCLRLLRRFDESWSCLQRAHAIASASENSFGRAQASCLVQMGDVRRCQGSNEKARESLREALELAEVMDLPVTRGFATSALGAVEFQEKEFDRAQATLREAQAIFDRCDHREGQALNARRQATVARYLSAEGIRPDAKEVKALIAMAEANYEALGSPAGVAACEIEKGWMRIYSPSCGKVGTVIRKLARILRDSRQRQSLELDAWVPPLLNEFGRQLDGSPEEKELAKEAKDLYKDAKRELTANGDQGLESVAEVAGRLRTRHGSPLPDLALAMGGESRRKRQPLALMPG